MSITSDLIRVGLSNADSTPVNFSLLVPNAKQRDLGPRAEYYDTNASPRVWWMVSAAFTGFEQRSSAGSGAAFQLIPYDAVNNLPHLTTSTQSAAGNNFIVTNPGITVLGTPIDGITSVRQNDELIFQTALGVYVRYTDPYATPLLVTTPITVNNAYADLVLKNKTGSSIAVTVNNGLDPGFNCSFIGPFTFVGTATLDDERTAQGIANPMCFVVNDEPTNAGQDHYRLDGAK